jgi:hypothetical protein
MKMLSLRGLVLLLMMLCLFVRGSEAQTPQTGDGGTATSPAPANQAQTSDQDKSLPLSPNDIAKRLNALDLGLKFEKSPDGAGVDAKLDKTQDANFEGKQGNNSLTVKRLFGPNFAIGQQESRGSKEVKSRAPGPFGRAADVGSTLMKKDNYLKSTGPLKDADVKLIETNAGAIRNVNLGKFESAAKAYADAHPAAGDDPGAQFLNAAMADPSMGARAGTIVFKAAGAKFQTVLSGQQAANLERVLGDPAFKNPAELFRTDQITYDAATKTVTVSDNISKADLDRFASGGNKLLQNAVDDGNPAESKELKRALKLGPVDQEQKAIRGAIGDLH